MLEVRRLYLSDLGGQYTRIGDDRATNETIERPDGPPTA